THSSRPHISKLPSSRLIILNYSEMSRRKGLNCRFSIETQVCISSSSSRLPETLPVFSANSLLQLLDYRASLNVLDHDNMDALLIRKAQLSRGYRDILA